MENLIYLLLIIGEIIYLSWKKQHDITEDNEARKRLYQAQYDKTIAELNKKNKL